MKKSLINVALIVGSFAATVANASVGETEAERESRGSNDECRAICRTDY